MIDVSLKTLGYMSKALSAVVATLVLAAPTTALAASAQELFADGNRLFKDDLYWAALLRYRQAADAGLESPLLHYNMGVAHYRAGQHLRARDSLRKASRSARLEVISHYNLGLNAWKMGEMGDALHWLRKARDQQQDRKIRKLAIRAIAEIRTEPVQVNTVVARAEQREQERKIGAFLFNARVGAGNDSNIFRAPSEPYVDQSDPALPLVTPEVQSGMYVPVKLGAKYVVNSFDHESFFAGYRLAGRYFPDEVLENGTEYVHELAIGSNYDRKTENRRRQVYSAFTIAHHDEVYYSRDDGEIRTFQGTDITDRFNYLRYGPEFSFRQKLGRFSFGFRIKGQLWNYENTQVVPEYDHTFLLGGLNLQYRVSETSLLRFTAEGYHRKFGDRPSFELDGTQPVNNPGVEYNYFELGLTARQRVFDGFWFGMNYKYRSREDMYLGYNNYLMNAFSTELHVDLGNRFEFDADVEYRLYDYENAFAFHNPAASRKTLERGFGSAELSYRISESFTIVGQYRLELVESNDARIAYDRNTMFLALRWDL
ncbi:MAG: tetratricopeptide repeat protein [Gammaproteobacteria bacterium]|nr:tetratricopeptide repeat protein [Gammaproteobacteria bacterium]